MYIVLNKLLEYIYFSISKNITLHFFVVFKILENQIYLDGHLFYRTSQVAASLITL